MFSKTRCTGRRWAATALAVGLLGAVVGWHASLRVATGPAAGVGLDAAPPFSPVAGSTVRLVTLNVASGRGPDRKYDLGRAADVLAAEQLDLAAVQEARGSLWPAADNQVAMLARRLRLGWLYAPAETQWYCRQFGNGVLGRLPVRHWQRIPLPCQYDRSRRNAVLLVIEGPGRPIHVLSTHLTQRDPRDRETQLRAVIALFLALKEPAVLMGDLNTTADDPALRDLLAEPGVDDPVARLVPEAPKGRVDWILLRGLTAVAAGMSDQPISDHPLYWVGVAWPAATNAEPSDAATPAAPHKREVE